MRMLLPIILMLASGTAEARHRPASPAAPTLAERIDAIAPGDVVEIPEKDVADCMVRFQLDVRFGPADTTAPDRSVWLANGPGRDGSMRNAGIDRLVLLRTPKGISVSALAVTNLASR